MVQFSKKVLATWAAVVVAEEIDLNLEAEKTVEVPVEEVSDLNLDDMDLDDDEEKLGMNLGDDAEADMDMGGLGDLFGMMGGAPSEEAKQIFAEHDANEDGKLDAEEFGKFLSETMWEMSEGQRGGKEYIEVANVTGEEADGLKAMDKNGDGQITKEEYAAGVGGANDGFFDMVDSNKSGGLEIEEFGFIVTMLNMGKGGHDGHDHAAHGDDHDHSQCSGHHHAEEPEAREHEEHGHQAPQEHEAFEQHDHAKVCTAAHENEQEHEHVDLENPSCSAKCTNATSCCAGDHCDETPVPEDFYAEDEVAPVEDSYDGSHDEL